MIFPCRRTASAPPPPEDAPPPPLTIRWLIRRDLPAVAAIERASFDDPWTEEDFVLSLRLSHTIGIVAVSGDEVAGFAVYELHPRAIRVVSLAVHPDYRRLGVCRALLRELRRKVAASGRTLTEARIAETNHEAQLAFRACGWRAIEIVHDVYNRPGGGALDAYVFAAPPLPGVPREPGLVGTSWGTAP